MTEFARLGLMVDSRPVDEASRSLDQLAQKGAKAERATDGMTNSVNRLGTASAQTSGRVRFMRGGISQLGFQVQDIAVQLQSGTNAMMVFGQQGSQIASLFGPAGAIAGAVIAIGAAIGGTLVSGLFDARSATDKLEESLAFLDKALDRTDKGALKLSESFVKMAQRSREAATVTLLQAPYEALNTLTVSAGQAAEKMEEFLSPSWIQNTDVIRDAVRTMGSQFRDTGEMVELFSSDLSEFMRIAQVDASNTGQDIGKVMAGYGSLARTIIDLGKDYGVTREQAISLMRVFAEVNDSASFEAIAELQKTLDAIAITGKNPVFIKLASDVREFSEQARTAEEEAAFLKKALDDIGVTAVPKAFTDLKESLEAQIALYGETSQAAKLRYDLEHGELKALLPEQKAVVIGLAQELDAKKALTEQSRKNEQALQAEKRAKDALNNAFASTEMTLIREIELQGTSARAAQLKFEITKGSLQGLEPDQKARIMALADEADKQDELVNIGQMLAGTYSQQETQLRDLRQEMLDLQMAMEDHPELADEITEALQRMGKQEQDLIEKIKRTGAELSESAKHAAENMQDAFAEFLFDPFDEGLDGMLVGFLNVIRRMVAEAAAVKVFEQFDVAGLLNGGIGGLAGGLFGGKTAGASKDLDKLIGNSDLFSFDGGGFTGNGPRSGGIDGKGGFLAINHPREVITDLTKPGAGRGMGTQNITINVTPAANNSQARYTGQQVAGQTAFAMARAQRRFG